MYRKMYITPVVEILSMETPALLVGSFGIGNSETSTGSIDDTPVEYGD